ncbi:MAG: hypothetical protein PHQ23_07510 [Candidatus Wallbacteria bacterium]|nr:hypothetical protein [Candidatus Wallbacteria bacterium]
MLAFVNADGNKIPISVWSSSWYWLRKEYLTLTEFKERCIGVETIDSSYKQLASQKPILAPQNYRGGKILVKYGKRKHVEKMLSLGEFRISPATAYAKKDLEDSRQDDELNRHNYIDSDSVSITFEDGTKIPAMGYLKHTRSIPTDYYLFCLSRVFDNTLFYDFQADACLVIHNPEVFIKRVERIKHSIFQDYNFWDFQVYYYDPFEPEENFKTAHDPANAKDFKFAYQKEHRMIWLPPTGKQAEKPVMIRIGSLEDIAEIYTLNEGRFHWN